MYVYHACVEGVSPQDLGVVVMANCSNFVGAVRLFKEGGSRKDARVSVTFLVRNFVNVGHLVGFFSNRDLSYDSGKGAVGTLLFVRFAYFRGLFLKGGVVSLAKDVIIC